MNPGRDLPALRRIDRQVQIVKVQDVLQGQLGQASSDPLRRAKVVGALGDGPTVPTRLGAQVFASLEIQDLQTHHVFVEHVRGRFAQILSD